MKIVFTHGYFLQEDPKEKLIMRPYPPPGILYISAYLEENGFPSMVFDSTFSTIENLKSFLLKEKPHVLGIYTNLMTKLNVLRIISFVKANESLRHTRIVLGGPEIRNHKENFLRSGADVVVFGEGEETMLELVQRFSDSDNTNLEDLPGTAFLDENDNIVTNPERVLIKDINHLPFPARHQIDLQKYFDTWKQYHGTSMINVNTMRGCPYSCKWCSRAVYGSSYRRRSPKLVVDEIQQLKQNYSFDMIWFVDDVFTINHKWLREFVEELDNRKLRVPYEIITRADRLNKEAVELLQKSGCFRVWIGAESGSQKIIDAMDRRVKVEDVRQMIQLVQSYGIEAGTFIMLGYPGEDETDIRETLHHLKTSNPDHYTITVAYPIKGTPLYSEVEDLFVEDLAWEKSTDRDIDFKRTYNRRYYDHAISWIHYEMLYHCRKKSLRSLLLKLKSLNAQNKMRVEKNKTT